LPNGSAITVKKGHVTSLDGSQTIPLEEFDRLFDEGSDAIDAFIDYAHPRIGHGGARPGAGRKPSGRRQYTIRLKPEVHACLKKQARAAHQTLAEYIENLAGI
jgi:predicted HicB family RNase H-like nuclease